MTTYPTEPNHVMPASTAVAAPSGVVSFHDAHWKTRWLVVGLVALVLWRSLDFVDKEWLASFPPWLLMLISGLLPQVLFLVFPMVTRSPNRRKTFGFPAAKRWWKELGIAIPVVIGTLILLATANFLVGRFSPGSSLTPPAMKNMAASPNHSFVYLLLFFSFTFAPIAEELFFRGFLQNALRARLPVVIAAMAQSLCFGFSHFFGFTHACIAVGLGLLLTVLYEWRKTLITPILVHSGINFFAALGMMVLMAARANSPVMGVGGELKDTECVIRVIAPHSAAEDAGLRVGDIIVSLDSEPIRNFAHFVETISHHRPGDTVSLTINRSGVLLQVPVVLRKRGES